MDNLETQIKRQSEWAPKRQPIPDEDLKIIEKIYHKDYPDCGRKRGALLRYIRDMRKEHEAPFTLKDFVKRVNRIVR